MKVSSDPEISQDFTDRASCPQLDNPVRESRLADGIFGILCNHDDMLLRRSTAEFSNEHAVPM